MMSVRGGWHCRASAPGSTVRAGRLRRSWQPRVAPSQRPPKGVRLHQDVSVEFEWEVVSENPIETEGEEEEASEEPKAE